MADLGKLKVAAFSVTVENDAEIRQWLDQIGKARDALEAQFKALIELTENTPLIQMTLHRSAQDDGEAVPTESHKEL